MKQKKIDRKNLPAKLPVTSTIVAIMAMDYWNAAEWIWGAVVIVGLIIWIACLWSVSNENNIDIFKNKNLHENENYNV